VHEPSWCALWPARPGHRNCPLVYGAQRRPGTMPVNVSLIPAACRLCGAVREGYGAMTMVGDSAPALGGLLESVAVMVGV
jgi:hypothetical protein